MRLIRPNRLRIYVCIPYLSIKNGEMPNLIKHPVIDGKKFCPACKTSKLVSEFNGKKSHFVTRCNPCAKEYAAAYRAKPEVKMAMLEYSRRYRAIPSNRVRINERTRIHNKSPRAKLVRNAARKAWTAAVKQQCIDYKGGKCVCCGYSGCLAAMDFHHRNPKEKEGYGTGALMAHWTFERNRPELDKCELVCVRCHREIHAGARAL